MSEDVGAVTVRLILFMSLLANCAFAVALALRTARAMWVGRKESLWNWREWKMLLLKSTSIAAYCACASWASYNRIDAGFEWYVVGMAFGSLSFSVYLYLRAGEQVPIQMVDESLARQRVGREV